MLVRRIVLPLALAGAEYGAALALLRDFVECGLVLVGNGSGPGAVATAVLGWPEPFRVRAVELMKELHRRRRFVAINTNAAEQGSCLSEICAELRGVAAATKVLVICSGDCCAETGPVTMLDISAYGASGQPDECRLSGSLRILDGETTAEQFEQKVLAPLMRYSQRVTVIDRQIGRTVNRDGSVSFMKAEYSDTLSWIASRYALNGRVPSRELRIVTGVDSRHAPERDALAIRRFCSRIAEETGIPVRCELALEWPQQLDHDRYLITDQTAVQIGRGFDLLWTDRAMRGCWTRSTQGRAADTRHHRRALAALGRHRDGAPETAHGLGECNHFGCAHSAREGHSRAKSHQRHVSADGVAAKSPDRIRAVRARMSARAASSSSSVRAVLIRIFASVK